MATVVTLHIHVAWWLKFYLLSVEAFSQLTGAPPDMGKVENMIGRGIKVVERP